MRDTGIDIIGRVPWGTHFCQFYETARDLVDVLVPYLAAGLAANEFCMWITSEPLHAEAAKAALEASVGGLQPYLSSGQLEILDYTEWYTVDGVFDADRVLQGWVDKLTIAQRKGFDGLRLTGNTFWLEQSGWQDFTEYEATIDGTIGQYRMLALCTYSLARCGAPEILDVMANHAFALIRRGGAWRIIESAERKKVEQERRETEERYRALFESMTEGFALHEIICDERGEPVDYRFREANPAFERLTGLKRESILGRTVREVLPEIEPRWIETYGKVALTGKPARLQEFAAPLGRHYEVYAYSPRRGQFAAIFSDITARRRAEQERELLLAEVERQRAWLETISEHTDAHLVFLDRDFNFLYVNRAYARGCRKTPDELLGHNHFEFYPHQENEAIFRRVRDTGEPFWVKEKPFEFPDMPERGTTYWDWTLTPIKGEAGRVDYLVFSLMDATEQVRQRERLVAAERGRAELLETLNQEISHRTKNNLAIVAGLLQLQLDRDAAPDAHTDMIHDAITRIMSVAAIHEQLRARHSDSVALLDGLRRIADMDRRALSTGEMQISVEGEPREYSSYVATNLCVVANELITNAIRHGLSQESAGRVEIRLGGAGGKLVLSVWNSGDPIAADFDVRGRSRTGLGLVRAIVEDQYGGTFALMPERGGTAARIVLDEKRLLQG